MKIYRILGKKGRITIPFQFQIQMGLSENDILSFELRDHNTIILRKERLCDCHKNRSKIDKHIF